MCSFIIYTAYQILGVSKNSGKMGEECGMHGGEGNLEQIFDCETSRQRGHSESLCEYGRIILKWMLRKCIGTVFDYSRLDRALNKILVNPVVNLVFHKLLRNLDKPSNHLVSQEILYTVCVCFYDH